MDIYSIIAAIIPSFAFLILILYFTVWKGGGYIPEVVHVKKMAKVVGLSTMTTDETFINDDLNLWKEFKIIREKNLVSEKIEPHSFVSVRMMPQKGAEKWEYIIGRIVHDFRDIPTGFKAIDIDSQLYVSVTLNLKVRNEESWGPTILKLEKYVYEKWMPESKYELNTDSKIKSIVYHQKHAKDKTTAIVFYVAIKEKIKA